MKMRIKIDDDITIQTIKTKTLVKMMNKRLAEVVEKLNVNPELIDTTEVSNAFRDYNSFLEIVKKVEEQGRERLFITVGYPFYYSDISVHTPINVMYYARIFGVSGYSELASSLRRELRQKRLPRYYIRLFEFRSCFALKANRSSYLFFAVPNKVPKISINFLPVFKDGRVVFVRKDKLDQIKQVQA
jgi:uncharacterized protein YkvS